MMPSAEWKENGDKLRAKLEGLRPKFLGALEAKLHNEELVFISGIQQKYMSGGGRTSPITPYSTRVITGQLRRNWFNQTVAQGQGITARVFTTTPYAPVHIYGGDFTRNTAWGKPSKSYTVHYPARIRVGEAWQADFVPQFKRAMQAAFQEAKA